MKYILLFAFVGMMSVSFGANFTAAATGGWNSGATWGNPGSVPGVDYPAAGDAVTIGDFSVFITGAESCASLTMNVLSVSQLQLFAGSLNVSGTLSITQTGGFYQFQNFGAVVNIGNLIINGSGGTCNFQHSAGTFTVSLISATMSNPGTVLTFTTAANFSITANSSLTAISDATININHSGGTFSSASTNLSYFPSTTAGGINISVSNASAIFNNSGNFFVSASDPSKVIIDLSASSGIFRLGGSLLGNVPTISGGTSGSTFIFDGAATQSIPTSSTIVAFDNLQVSNTSGTDVTIDAPLTSTNLLGDLVIDPGSMFSHNNQSVDVSSGSFSNGGAYTLNAPLTVSGVLVNSGTINQTAAITATGNITNSGTINTSTSIDANGNFTNSGTLASTGVGITLAGNWNNTGGTYTFNALDSITFDGTTGLNTIDGATNWNTLIINHAGTGVDVNSGAQTIRKILDLDQGTFSVDAAASVTLLSDASGSAQLDVIETGAAWDGASNLTVQRYIPKVAQSFTSLGSPVSGTTLASWQDDNIIYTGDGAGTFTGADFETFGWHNTYWYDEGAANGVMNDGFTKATTTAQAVGASNSYRAFHIYTDAVTYNIDVTGVPNTGNVSIPLAYDGAFAGNQAGWNLIANPYACTIDFNAIYAAGMVNGYFVYNDGNANYDWYDGSDGSNLVSMTRYIPHTQGFWVRSTGLTSISVTESDKRRTDQAFYKSSNNVNLMRVKLTGNVNMFLDAAVIIERNDFSNGYEVDVDIQKFKTLNPDNAPTISTFTNDGYEVCFNRISGESISIPLDAKAGTLAQGLYTMDFDIPSTFMEGACITLEDLHTGTITDLRADTSYSYTTSDTTTLPRFIIHLVKDINTNATALTCFGTNDGVVAITGNGITGSSFSLLDGAGNVINTGTASNDSITFNNVSGGTYEVSTNYTGGCSSNNTYAITVAEPMLVTADFSLLQDTLYLDQNDILEVANNSSGTNFVWDFGDGNTSTFVNPTHTYISPGVYPVMLTSNNDNVGQCTEVTTKNVVVMSAPLSIEEVLNDNSTKAYVRKGYIVVEFDLENETELEIVLIDINGKKITNTLEYISSGRIDLISTDVLANGVYIVNIIGNNQTISKKLIIE